MSQAMASRTERINEVQQLHVEMIELLQKMDEISSMLQQKEARQRELMFGGVVSIAPAPAIISSPAPTPTKGKAAPVAKVKQGRKGKNGNEQPLREVIWEILSRKENSNGLLITEVVDIIEHEKSWKSKSDDIGPMVQTQIYNYKGAGKLIKTPERKYKIK